MSSVSRDVIPTFAFGGSLAADQTAIFSTDDFYAGRLCAVPILAWRQIDCGCAESVPQKARFTSSHSLFGVLHVAGGGSETT